MLIRIRECGTWQFQAQKMPTLNFSQMNGSIDYILNTGLYPKLHFSTSNDVPLMQKGKSHNEVSRTDTEQL